MARVWRLFTGFDGTTRRGVLTPIVYVAVYLGLLAMSLTPDLAAMRVLLAGIRVGMTLAAVSARGLRYLAGAFLVATLLYPQGENSTGSGFAVRLAAATLALLVGAYVLRWMSRRTESRTTFLYAVLFVAGLVILGMYGASWVTGDKATLHVLLAYSLGILVPMPVTLAVMTDGWPSWSRRTLVLALLAGLLLTAANAFIVFEPFLGTKLIALSLPMGLVIWVACRGGLVPVSAALLNVTVFASMCLPQFVTPQEGHPLSSIALLLSFVVIAFLLGAHVDDLGEARAALEAREGQLRSDFDGSPILMSIVECSEKDVLYVRANAAMSRELGREPGGVDGRWSSTLGFAPTRDRFWLDRFAEAQRIGAPLRFDYELTYGGPRCRSATVCHLGTSSSGRPRFASFIEDATDSVRRADERERFFSVSLDLFCIAELDAVPRRVNPAFESVLGWPDVELTGTALTKFVHPEDVAVTASELERLAEGAPRVVFTNRFRCKDGTYRWLLWAGATVPGEERIYLAAKDVTAQKDTEERLVQAKEEAEAAARAKMQFLANMSHELRTPVNGIIAFIELALGTELDELGRDYLKRCRSSCDALLAVVNDVLDFSKIDAGALQLDSIGFDLAELVEDVIRIVEVRAREKGLSLKTVVDPELPVRCSGDSVRIRQVLINLVANAVKFTEDGWVRVTARLVETRKDTALVRLEVADTGIGIAPEKRDAIFRPFIQAEESTTRRYGGTGLGLAIASQIVEAMGGRLTLESEPGRGSLFHFTLPLTLDVAHERVAPVEHAPDPSLGSLRILLAEDHPVNQLVARRLLEGFGHNVTTASDGNEAVRLFGVEQFDLVLMDVQMPELDGLDASRTIRSIEKKLKLPPIPIIALTALATNADPNRCRDAGMTGYLAKPIVRRALVEAIDRACGPRWADVDPDVAVERREDAAADESGRETLSAHRS